MSFRDTLGIRVEERANGSARLTFDARREHLNDGGIVHGGALATLADCAMGSAFASTLGNEQPVTVEAKINYLAPAQQGIIVACASIRRKGTRFTVLEAELFQEATGEHVAYATATFTLIG